MASQDAYDLLYANRDVILRVTEEVERISTKAEIYTSLLAMKTLQTEKAQKDLQDLQTQVSALVQAFLKERGYL